jgi:hypothetical protein
VNYHNRFKKLDEVFASDVVGDGSTGIMGPFEAAQTVPYRSGEPSVVGAFGDVNEALEKVLKQVAKAAAAGTDGLSSQFRHLSTQKGGSISNHAPTIQTSHRMWDCKRTSQTHTWMVTLCEGNKGRSSKCVQNTS